jgi:hypothetical protein
MIITGVHLQLQLENKYYIVYNPFFKLKTIKKIFN